MEVLKLTGKIDDKGQLKVDVPTNLEAGTVHLVVIVNPSIEQDLKQDLYDFSSLEGTLGWKGDAVATQRKLRDEW